MAFYTDVERKVEPVTSGAWLILQYDVSACTNPVTPCLYSWGVGGGRLYNVFATFDIVRGQLQMDMGEAAI